MHPPLVGISAIGSVHDGQQAVVFFEVVIAVFETGPELHTDVVARIFVFQVVHAAFTKAGRENVYRYEFLPVHFCIEANGVELFYTVIGHGHTADSDASAMYVYVATEMIGGSIQVVGVIGIIKQHREVVFAVWVEFFYEVESFRHLAVALGALGAEVSRYGTDRVCLD